MRTIAKFAAFIAVTATLLAGSPAQADDEPAADITVTMTDCATVQFQVDVVGYCRDHGWVFTHRLRVSRHGVLVSSTLPHCTYEDGSGSTLPCTWNIGPGADGNGAGLSYWVSRTGKTHYVWLDDPTKLANSRWTWMNERQRRQWSHITHHSMRWFKHAAIEVGDDYQYVIAPNGQNWHVNF